MNDKRNQGWRSPLRWVALVLGVVAAAYLAGVTTWVDQWRGMRDGDQYEEFYWYMAQQLGEPSICDKISWAAQLRGGFFLSPSYQRSACYDMVAGRTRSPWPCWKVRRLGAQSVFSDQLSMFSCLYHAASYSSTAISGESLVRFFGMMGYDPDELQVEGVTRPIVDVRDFYRRLPEEPDIVTRAGALLQALERERPSTSADVEDVAYLADMAALASKNAGWCQRIPDDLPLAAQKQHFRDWCLFTLATNIQDGDVCRRIPVRPYPIARAAELPPEHVREINLQMSLRTQCERQVHSTYLANPRYAPELPGDDERTRRLILLLGYPIPRASTLPLPRLAEAYSLFLTALTGVDAPSYAAARQRLIERVKALPNISWQGTPAAARGTR